MNEWVVHSNATAAFVVLAFFVLAPTVAAVYRASNVKPKNFDREMYWTAFVAIGAVAVIITRYAVFMEAKDVAWWNLLRLTLLGLGALFFGASLGFGVGIFCAQR